MLEILHRHTVISARKGDYLSGCGGSIISKHIILTSAHCVWGATDILIEMGHSNTTSEKIAPKLVESMLIHPEYDHAKQKERDSLGNSWRPIHWRRWHDIALLRVLGDITFDYAIQPITISKKEVKDSFKPFLVYPQEYIKSHLMLELWKPNQWLKLDLCNSCILYNCKHSVVILQSKYLLKSGSG